MIPYVSLCLWLKTTGGDREKRHGERDGVGGWIEELEGPVEHKKVFFGAKQYEVVEGGGDGAYWARTIIRNCFSALSWLKLNDVHHHTI